MNAAQQVLTRDQVIRIVGPASIKALDTMPFRVTGREVWDYVEYCASLQVCRANGSSCELRAYSYLTYFVSHYLPPQCMQVDHYSIAPVRERHDRRQQSLRLSLVM